MSGVDRRPDRHGEHKAAVLDRLDELATASPGDVRAVLRRLAHDDATWEVFAPFGSFPDTDAAAEGFWAPLASAFPDHDHRPGVVVAGEYGGADWVSTVGLLHGTFARPWASIPATEGLCSLRIGLHLRLDDGRVTAAYVHLDVVDVMRQAGCYPFRRMPGSSEQWPMPTGVLAGGRGQLEHDGTTGARTLEVVIAMQDALGFGSDLVVPHSPHWHPRMGWYGPAGIGSTWGQRGFEEQHCALFVQAFPDAADYDPDTGGPSRDHHDLLRLGDGRYTVTGGWPQLVATHTGGGFLGQVPSGRVITMRVADWYRTDAEDRIVDNWVMIDLLDMLEQMGHDVLADLSYLNDPSRRRWPPVG